MLQAQVRIGGKGTVRRKKKVVHRTATTDDKKLQSSLKKLSVNNIPGIEEMNKRRTTLILRTGRNYCATTTSKLRRMWRGAWARARESASRSTMVMGERCRLERTTAGRRMFLITTPTSAFPATMTRRTMTLMIRMIRRDLTAEAGETLPEKGKESAIGPCRLS